MQFLGRDPDLCTHAVLLAIRKRGRGIEHDGCRIHVVREVLQHARISGDHGFRVPRGVACDVLRGPLNAVDDTDGNVHRKVLLRPIVLVGLDYVASPKRTKCCRVPVDGHVGVLQCLYDGQLVRIRQRRVKQHRFSRVAHRHPARLAIDDNVDRLLNVR